MRHCIPAALVLLILTSCSPSSSAELSRTQAKALLSAHKTFTTKFTELHWVQGGYQEYIAQGGAHNPAFVKALTRADAQAAHLYESKAVRIDEITGITDAAIGQGMKEVEFRWSYQNLPEVLTPFLTSTGRGQAVMRLYDDGWRIMNVSVEENHTPPTLTASQKKQIEIFRETERTRERAAAAEAERREAELKRRLVEAKTPTRTIGEYVNYVSMDNTKQRGIVKLSDVDFYLPISFYKVTVGFALIKSVQKLEDQRASVFVDLKQMVPPYYSINVSFPDPKDRDRFFQDLQAAFNAWALKYPEFR